MKKQRFFALLLLILLTLFPKQKILSTKFDLKKLILQIILYLSDKEIKKHLHQFIIKI